MASTTSSPIAAASRSPRLSPWAPIGGMTCAASPTSAMRRAAMPALHAAERENSATRFELDLAQN